MSNVIQITKYDGRNEIFFKEELIVEIIKSFIKNEEIILRSDEGNSFVANGLYTLLDTLVKAWDYDPSKIILESNNPLQSHSLYNVKLSAYNTDFLFFSKPAPVVEWDKSKIFGMFIGLARFERIYSLLRYRRSNCKDLGLTSFNNNFRDFDTNLDICAVSQYADCKINDIVSIEPYSDIDTIRKPPICSDLNAIKRIWVPAYEKIAIEIVCETNCEADTFHITEKTLRPMYYRRPMLVIGSVNYMKRLRDMGFRTFENIIPQEYDSVDGLPRVDAVFTTLENLIQSKNLDNILTKCRDDLEHNYQLVQKISNIHLINKINNPNYYKFD